MGINIYVKRQNVHKNKPKCHTTLTKVVNNGLTYLRLRVPKERTKKVSFNLKMRHCLMNMQDKR